MLVNDVEKLKVLGLRDMIITTEGEKRGCVNSRPPNLTFTQVLTCLHPDQRLGAALNKCLKGLHKVDKFQAENISREKPSL